MIDSPTGRAALGTLVWVFLLVGIGASPAFGAEPAAWDQDRVQALARELAQRADAVQEALHRGPQSSVGSGQSSAFYRLKQDVRRARNEARHLASQLESGKGREETLPVYEDLMVLVRDAAENARRLFMPDSTLQALNEAGGVLQRITPYYEAQPSSEE